jgi:hypothetical protein
MTSAASLLPRAPRPSAPGSQFGSEALLRARRLGFSGQRPRSGPRSRGLRSRGRKPLEHVLGHPAMFHRGFRVPLLARACARAAGQLLNMRARDRAQPSSRRPGGGCDRRSAWPNEHPCEASSCNATGGTVRPREDPVPIALPRLHHSGQPLPRATLRFRTGVDAASTAATKRRKDAPRGPVERL